MGIHGEEYHLAWDKFPAVALAKTRSNFLHFLSVISDKEFWYKDAQEGIRRRLALFGESHLPEDRAKNIILMVGDGMGLSTLTASRILKGQRMGIHGEEYHLAWDKFPAVALAK
ncbi:alkaline phosphatase, tissue-nonspecific isozyme-like, partial [Diaphorina citri]|uniref:alkaline phosphatase n=1 Tax=Diaphorina citri TaxID=121845 RepID=A0A3Q0JC68_DIACI